MVGVEDGGRRVRGIEDVLKGVSKVRNRVLARVFKELGYIEPWGSGLQRIAEACAVRGLKI